MLRTFELDDIPNKFDEIMPLLDGIHERFPKFKANLFAVLCWMEPQHLEEIAKRKWCRVFPHGFHHVKGECRDPKRFRRYLPMLDELPDVYGKMFKAPWHGTSKDFCQELRARSFSIATRRVDHLSFPAPDWPIWNVADAKAKSPRFVHLECHPPGNAYSGFTPARIAFWTRRWSQDDEFSFVDELTKSAICKIHLGCGDMVWPGWDNLDPRPLHPDIIDWDSSRMLPVCKNRADIAFISHVMNYVADEDYEQLFLEVWRVLRPGGVFRVSEERGESGRVWRRIGQSARGTGVIRSVPTQRRIYEALQNVGFLVYDTREGFTISPHQDVLQGDSRLRRYRLGQKFYADALKAVDPPAGDPRETRHGRYRLFHGRSLFVNQIMTKAQWKIIARAMTKVL